MQNISNQIIISSPATMITPILHLGSPRLGSLGCGKNTILSNVRENVLYILGYANSSVIL